MKPFLSVALLCCNERLNLPPLIAALEKTLSELGVTFELVVIDDGSTDGTATWLAARDGDVPIRVHRHEKRRGYGAAVKSALLQASGDRVVYMDGDGQLDPFQIGAMLDLMESGNWDVVIGERVQRQDALHRRLIADSYNAFARYLLGHTFRDLDCGFKMFRRHVVDQLDLNADGNVISAELLAQILSRGYRVRQIPVNHFPRQHGESKAVDSPALIKTVVELATLWRKLRNKSKR